MEVDNPTPKVGYNPKLFDNQQTIQNYICAICNNVLKDAVQIPQSTNPKRACHDCYNSNIRNGVCPIFGTHNTTSYPDKFADREIRDLTVACENKENGCRWSDRLGNYEEHLSSCDYRTIVCERCQQIVVYFQHENNCPNVQINCPACCELILRKNIADHNLTCRMQYQTCECGEQISPNELGTKLLTHWQHQHQTCLYSYIGCGIEKSTPHSDSRNHEALLVSNIVELKQNNVILKQSNEEKDVKLQQLEKEVTQLKEQNVALTERVSDMSAKMIEMHETVQALKKEVEILKDEPGQPQLPVIGGGARLKKDVEDLKSKVSNLDRKNEEHTKLIADMDLKIQLQENKTKNGELIWKIDKIEYRMAQARLGKMVALHSAPCYTKQYEYKYCARLYLHGDGMGRSTHISIFFVVMKSEYDQLLAWPMRKRITFELINLQNEADSIIESFVSNPRSSSFQRPTNNMNVASGCPMFITIERFLTGGFIIDDCAYIKTLVQDVD